MEKSILDKNILGSISDEFKEEKIISEPSLIKDDKTIIKEIKRDKRIMFRIRMKIYLLSILKNLTNPDYYASVIQKFENLIMIIFIDSFYIGILLSMMYAMYIIYNFDNYDKITAISKFVGIIVISIICIVVQVNVHKTK